MRIISLLPSTTEIIFRLGLADALVGRSNECTYPPEVLDRPVVTAARIDPTSLESVEIDRQVREAIKDGRSLYAVDAELLERLAPDVIVTQDLAPR
jgi:iron complex transport system substrate-binding protein